MKVRRTEKIKVDLFRVGDVIRFKLSDGEKVEMLAVKEEKDGMIFCFADCLAKEYSMNAQNTNAGGWDASDLRKKLNGEILDRFPQKIRKLLLPFENGDLLRLPTEKEIFGSNPCGEDEPESVSQWKPMKQRKNRIASQGLNGGWEWYWLQNRASSRQPISPARTTAGVAPTTTPRLRLVSAPSPRSRIPYPHLPVRCGTMKTSRKVEVKSMDGLVKTLGTVLLLLAAAIWAAVLLLAPAALAKLCWLYLFA